jgi:hypothetical protein
MEPVKIDHKKEPTFVKIETKGNMTTISYAFHVLQAKKEEKSKNFNYYIPAFDIYYFAKSEVEGDIIGEAMLESFFNFWFDHKGLDKLAIELHRLGFEANNHKKVMADIVKNRTRKANFSSIRNSVPNGFETATVKLKSGELEAA